MLCRQFSLPLIASFWFGFTSRGICNINKTNWHPLTCPYKKIQEQVFVNGWHNKVHTYVVLIISHIYQTTLHGLAHQRCTMLQAF